MCRRRGGVVAGLKCPGEDAVLVAIGAGPGCPKESDVALVDVDPEAVDPEAAGLYNKKSRSSSSVTNDRPFARTGARGTLTFVISGRSDERIPQSNKDHSSSSTADGTFLLIGPAHAAWSGPRALPSWGPRNINPALSCSRILIFRFMESRIIFGKSQHIVQ